MYVNFIVMFLLCKHVRLTCVLNKLMMMMNLYRREAPLMRYRFP